MKFEIVKYTKDRIADVIEFEKRLRQEEDFWGWEINEEYKNNVMQSFESEAFQNAVSFLAYVEGQVVGRIDASLIVSRFEGKINAYLDWICVLKSYRHFGIAQQLMKTLRSELKKKDASVLIGLIASNEEAQHFYRSLENSSIHAEGIWIDL